MQVSPIPGVNFGIILVNYCCERLLTRDKIAISIKSCLKEKPALYCIARYCVLPALEQEQCQDAGTCDREQRAPSIIGETHLSSRSPAVQL